MEVARGRGAIAADRFRELQLTILDGLQQLDPDATARNDVWSRDHGEGGGDTRIIEQGRIFEKGGVNFSSVWGNLPADLSEKLTGQHTEQRFFATGTSLVIHPSSPLVPTVHLNVRYLNVGSLEWFGGGTDLTPYYLFDEDAIHFHQVLRSVCDRFDGEFYPKFKKWCDDYFYLPHRQEGRGIGGIFFDYLGRDEPDRLDDYFRFTEAVGRSFLDAYSPIVERRASLSFSAAQKHFQLLRRGRYVEFNLIWDRGTLFGLKTNGRAESILMSLPLEVRWEYCPEVSPGGDEERLLSVLRSPIDWLARSAKSESQIGPQE
ncbi:MAG: oxygen-dependent coproporphyrinogen oxidase [Bdellovibrionales bacterium]|nr:oxygen-dependent coproporphyrinogen oxidase [Bdellovibrionales bacterium]